MRYPGTGYAHTAVYHTGNIDYFGKNLLDFLLDFNQLCSHGIHLPNDLGWPVKVDIHSPAQLQKLFLELFHTLTRSCFAAPRGLF